jgi:hypothetical protein
MRNDCVYTLLNCRMSNIEVRPKTSAVRHSKFDIPVFILLVIVRTWRQKNPGFVKLVLPPRQRRWISHWIRMMKRGDGMFAA